MRYIDLFAGCGGLSLGLEKSGFELVLAVEKSPMAAETYYHNFIKPIVGEDQWKKYCSLSIDKQFENKLIVNELRKLLDYKSLMDNLSKQNIDLVVGGPPCQGFSMVGKRNPDDVRNQLPWQFLEFVEKIIPKAVVMENVIGIKQNFAKHGVSSPVEELRKALENTKLGYTVQPVEINSMHFGVPQNRPRVMLLAVRNDVIADVDVVNYNSFWKSEYDLNSSDQFKKRPTLVPKVTCKLPLTVRDAIWDLSKEKYKYSFNSKKYLLKENSYARDMRQNSSGVLNGKAKGMSLANHNLRNHTDRVKDRFRLYQYLQKNNIPSKVLNLVAKDNFHISEIDSSLSAVLCKASFPAISPDGKVIANSQDDLIRLMIDLKTRKHSQRPLKIDMPSPTVLSLPDDFVHPLEPRTMTVREMARFQSFPDSFEFRAKETTGSLRRRFEVPQYTQVGNAVPPILAEAVGKQIYSILSNKNSFI